MEEPGLASGTSGAGEGLSRSAHKLVQSQEQSFQVRLRSSDRPGRELSA